MSNSDDVLKIAKQAWDDMDKVRANQLARQILEYYPDSEAAIEAQAMVDGLSHQPGKSKTVSAKPTARPAPPVESDTTSYDTERGVANIIEFIGWLIVVAGIIAGMVAVVYKGGAIGYFGAFGVSLSGFLLIMGAQVVKATVDNADQIRKILTEIQRRKVD